ncbi:TRAP transporter substrate-binding protein [Marinimicrobium alkaliphilum]|uniref:TRAP transporter substrate-binding protein n=1 Tax=Marinimicrobium alkaliphilum TaxID=2202654 RepID=UPI000DB8FD2F|nr:TRAP transporter substrate-binding protein [Marinimicrobium alkaliphilum]
MAAALVLAAGCDQFTEVTTLKMAHDLNEQTPVHKAMVYMADRLEELSDGKMRIEVHASGVLGNERELMELLQIGSLGMTKVSAGPMENFVSEFQIFSIPFAFRDREHFWNVLEGDLGREILESSERVRLRGLGYYDAGSRSFYAVNRQINDPSDLAGMKIRVLESQTAMRMVSTLGGAPTPVSWGELYTALQQGVVDGAENNPPSFYLSGHYEVAKYYSLNEHTSIPDVVLISTHIWNNLEPQEQAWLQQAMDDSVVFQRKLWDEATQEALDAVKAAGVEVIYPDKEPFMESIRPMHESLRGQPVYELLQRVQNDY